MVFETLSVLPVWIAVPLVFMAWVLAFSLVKKLAFLVARKLAARTRTQVDDILFDALELPLQLMIYATGVLAVEHIILKQDADVARYLLGGFKVAFIFAIVLFIDAFLRGLVVFYSRKMDVLRTSAGVVQGFIRVVIYGLGALVMLDSFGVSITPIIASLGIGSLAVALALQPTLENFFSGIQLIADKPIQVGHFIKLESGEEGKVERIGWRSTWISLSNNNTIVIPNKLLVNSRVTNFYYPDAEIAVVVAVGVHYRSDLEKVERLALEVGRDVQKAVAGAVISAEPVVRYQSFGDHSISCHVALRAKDFSSTALVKHAFIKRLHARFIQEGIAVAYPMRSIVQEK